MDLFLAKDETANLVKGPNDLPGLFQWASFNAKTLFTDPIHKKSFESLVANTDFEIYDFFAGSGNGSTTMKNQFHAMTTALG